MHRNHFALRSFTWSSVLSLLPLEIPSFNRKLISRISIYFPNLWECIFEHFLGYTKAKRRRHRGLRVTGTCSAGWGSVPQAVVVKHTLGDYRLSTQCQDETCSQGVPQSQVHLSCYFSYSSSKGLGH